jgi:hypothetical protein
MLCALAIVFDSMSIDKLPTQNVLQINIIAVIDRGGGEVRVISPVIIARSGSGVDSWCTSWPLALALFGVVNN